MKKDNGYAVNVIVSNTSPLIAFSAVNELPLLRSLFGQVLIPVAVYDEIVTNGEAWEEAAQIRAVLKEGDWIRKFKVNDSEVLRQMRENLDRGEAEAVALAFELRMALLIDEREGRKWAARWQLEFFGTLGALRVGKKKGLIPETREIIAGMRRKGIWFSPILVDCFLKELNEPPLSSGD